MKKPVTEKVCTKCRESKKITEFSKSPSKSSKDGLLWQCKTCTSAARKSWRLRNLHSLYGITLSQFNQMLEQRGPKCPICGLPNDKPNIDHCHKTGKVRGLLCTHCNTALGMLRDDPKACLRAAVYLKHAGEPGFPCTFNTLDDFATDIARRKNKLSTEFFLSPPP